MSKLNATSVIVRVGYLEIDNNSGKIIKKKGLQVSNIRVNQIIS